MQSTLLFFSTNVRTRCSASLLCFAPEFRPIVYNQWTGLVDWTSGLDWWIGLKIIFMLTNENSPVELHMQT